jgi:hypothetical protein
MRQQNIGACADYVQVRWSIFLLFWPGKVCSSWLLPDLADVLPLEMLSAPYAVTKVDWLPLAALLLWADPLPHCPGLFVPAPHAKMSQNLESTNIGACQDFTDFRQNSAVDICAHRRPIKNW